jgi:hypothetical protein
VFFAFCLRSVSCAQLLWCVSRLSIIYYALCFL